MNIFVLCAGRCGSVSLYKICKHTKSNTIVFVKGKQLYASGVGQTSRVDALKQAVEKDHGNEVLMQQFTTFKLREGTLLKETVTRRFDFFGDYHDDFSSEPILQVQKVPKEMLH